MQTSTTLSGSCDAHADEYAISVKAIASRFLQETEKADALLVVDSSELFNIYLDHVDDRRLCNCDTCSSFFRRYGGIVVVSPDGSLSSPLWHPDLASSDVREAIVRVRRHVLSAPVVGVFRSATANLGVAEAGGFSHFHASLPKKHVFTSVLESAEQRMAGNLEEFRGLRAALVEYKEEDLVQAIDFLSTVSGGSDFSSWAAWLLQTKRSFTAAAKDKRANILWLASANAPSGWCFPRNTVLGNVISGFAQRLGVHTITANYTSQHDARTYQRPQEAPAEGAVAAAEKIVDTLGIRRAFARRYATPADVQEWLWRIPQARPASSASSDGLFAGLAKSPAPTAPKFANTQPRRVSWEKFKRLVDLNGLSSLLMQVPVTGPFYALLTAVHGDAPPLIRWDDPENRNPVSHYMYTEPSRASQWLLAPGTWHTVSGITRSPRQWGRQADLDMLLFVLAGSSDSGHEHASLCLFPTIVRQELHGVRSVIEAYSNANKLSGYDPENNVAGLAFKDDYPPVQLAALNPITKNHDVFIVDRLV